MTLICRAASVADGLDVTKPDDYFADEGDPRVGGPSVDELGSPEPATSLG